MACGLDAGHSGECRPVLWSADEPHERSLRHLNADDLALLATALEERHGNWKPGVGFAWDDNDAGERAEEMWAVIVMILEVNGNRPVWQQVYVVPYDDDRWWVGSVVRTG